IIFINTCSIRDNAEQRIWSRLRELRAFKKRKPSLIVGIIGCMAERLKDELIEKEQIVDLVIGPDGYRTIPMLTEKAESGQKGVNVLLSREETYAEISPVRLDKNGVSAFVSIMRGCNNMCSYCVVPYTRGRERSRSSETIINEVQELINKGYKEVTLLGQNVNSYLSGDENINFPQLIEKVAQLSKDLRVRFSTSHPKDISDELIETIARNNNICKAIHLPAQSGSTRMLEIMNRKYTREWYLDRIAAIKKHIPDCTISTDIIAGFCGETEQDHKDTLSLMKEVGYASAFMFKYSMRPNTYAEKCLVDDVSESLKTERLTEIINLQRDLSLESNLQDVGKVFEVLIEGVSKRNSEELFGRTSQNKVVVFKGNDTTIGTYATVKVDSCSSATLLGHLV
ncbi:MAG: tRNA (N6-isopentenyl adenosine(37)-C2)-methylthiotransferase MiaB, partial [Rikenellaceae bacterium]